MNIDRAGGGLKMALNIESDVLVIGSGGAGLRAAIEAELGGASVTVVSKAPAGMNNSTAVSGGGFRAPIGGLTREEYIRDTIEVGKGLNDRRLVEVMAGEGERRLLELRSFGVDVKGREGGIYVEWRGGAQGDGPHNTPIEVREVEGHQGPRECDSDEAAPGWGEDGGSCGI
jgi:succinate dehydrogenase/fumarate reductase flavoprotein subunit